MRIAFVSLLFATAIAAAQTAPSPPVLASDAASEALLKRFQAASDPREAQRVFDEIKAAGEKSPQAAYLCGVLAAQPGGAVADRAVAMRCFESAARSGVPDAPYCVALMLLDEKSDAAREAEAERWLTTAAQFIPEAVYALAMLRASRQPTHLN